MEDVLRAIVLGIVQGLTEFLPISSSGHLIVTRELFGWEFSDDLTFDVALHLGTTIGVIAFFWREWAQMLRSALALVLPGGGESGFDDAFHRRLLFLVALGSIPVAVVGLIFNDYVENEVRSPIVVGAMLLVFGAVLFAAERLGSRERTMPSSGWRDAVQVGLAQAISLVPGVSRSGVTISAGLMRGFTRQDAARFSFLLSTPVIVGAGVLKLSQAAREGIPSGDVGAIVVGTIISAVVGWLSIWFLLRLVQSRSYLPFVAYRVVAGVFILVYFLA